jgi:hypothetical protein
MNKEKVPQSPDAKPRAKHPIHPYFTSNTREETLRRMKGIRERIAKFEEQQRNADREPDKG